MPRVAPPLSRAVVSLPLAALALAAPLAAQDIPETVLAKPSATIRKGLESASALRELPGGRVLVWEPRKRTLHRADFATGKLEALSRGMEDPEAIQGVGAILPWAGGDSLLIHDVPKGRMVVLGGDGAVARTFPVGDPLPMRTPGAPPAPPAGGARRVPPLARFLYGTTSYVGQGASPPVPRQSAVAAPPRALYPVVRVQLADLRVDTVVQLFGPQPPRGPRSTGTGAMMVSAPLTPLLPTDLWAAYGDGTVAVIRSGPYRLDLYPPGGARQQGPVIPAPAIEMDEARRKAYMAEFRKQTEAATRDNPRMASVTVTIEEPTSWPKQAPPFYPIQQPMVDGQDRIWLMTPCATSLKDTCVDVLARDGVRELRFRLPGDGTLMGIGVKSIYYAVQDKDDVVLHRFDLPGAP